MHRRDEPQRCAHLLHARESAFHVAAIALAFGHFGFRSRPAIGIQGAPDFDLFLELALFVTPHVTLIARAGFN